ncbi:hypothetical protein UlMin_029914 [Ulmus minor]
MGCCCSYPKYDVFLSFRGEDTRNGFASHLFYALERNKIKAYMDDNSLKRGDEISKALLKAIKKSKLSVIIFSENYASSSWCLDELVQILRCKKKYGQVVVPIFYGVEPSHVREQKGTYLISSQRPKAEKKKLKAWRGALEKASKIAGWDSQIIRPDAKLIEEIVKDVKKKVKASFCCMGSCSNRATL